MADNYDTLLQFADAVCEMCANNNLAKANPHEDSLTTHLSALMVERFPDWDVSAEWSRREQVQKKIAWDDAAGEEQLKLVKPDIIVHHYHTEENLLIIEAKRFGTKSVHWANDITKLSLMTLRDSSNPEYHYGYEVGVHLIIDMPNHRITGCDVYRDGEVDAELTGFLRDLLPAGDGV
ncbi:hypothetical protein X769_15650 [Mesorhizobium sp. LSJC268A00]|uniref:hypothetical protein n=1 Tax=unclassified Mesorhizobium TaxID=325217 RepID=UPI0003CE9D61|nr:MULTISPECIES: hypothetical protein [unclassified Mesorhizobium]ESX03909.1 hypothetical protein X769_15650 [Mesorhizobium sp. LSJC268A00]ESZ10771.1 hypothetical protein X735_27570 [Mesorhizobium sp. L2C085B000]